MKIHWLSNAPWACTGYGNQTALFAPRLKALGHDVSITAFYGLEGGVLNLGGIPVYPKGYTPYGQDIGNANAMHAEADVLITLMDAWVCNADSLQQNGMRWIPWFPVDSNPLAPPIAEQVCKAHARIVFSRFGEQQVHDAGMDCVYIPHGCDTAAFRPIDQKEAREYTRIPQDRFVVGMVAANKGNPSRKAFQQQIEAFAMLKRKRKDALLYLHTIKAERGENQGVNLPELLAYNGLEQGKDYLFSDQYRQLIGAYPADAMAYLYSSFDVLTSVSHGEGFGIPILEAQACGVPVIVGGWTSMQELCFSGWQVGVLESTPIWTPLATYQFIPHTEAIYDRMQSAYSNKGNDKMRAKARQGALAYDANLVTETYWRPYLSQLESELNSAQANARGNNDGD